jgi:hypothetical protein
MRPSINAVTSGIALLLLLVAALLPSTAAAQIVCELCAEMQPGWEGFVVTSQESPVDCKATTASPGALKVTDAAGAWQKDVRRVAAVAFGRLPREKANDEKAGTLLRQMTIVLETDTDAIVLGQAGRIEQRVCLVRAGRDDAWTVVRLDSADLSRPAPAAKP